MRIYPISTVNYYTKVSNQSLRTNTPTVTMPKEVQFKSIQGGIGAFVGTVCGIALGAFTGGLGTILIGSMMGCAAGGAIGESKSEGSVDTLIDSPFVHD